MPKIEDLKMKHAVNGFIIQYDYSMPVDKSDEFSHTHFETKQEVFSSDQRKEVMDRFIELGSPEINKDTKDVTGTAHQSDHAE